MTTILEKLLQNLAPHECIVCCNEGYTICPTCAGDLINEQFSCCMGCLLPSNDYATCPSCARNISASHVFVLGDYSAELKQLIHLLKYEHVRQVAQDVTAGWEQLLPLLPRAVLVTHVPTTPRRERQRSFDQAALLAAALATRRGLKHRSLFTRVGELQQVGASRQQRFKQAQSMFALRREVSLQDKAILLVDDVITTGASIGAAAALLKQAGAKQVFAIALARQT